MIIFSCKNLDVEVSSILTNPINFKKIKFKVDEIKNVKVDILARTEIVIFHLNLLINLTFDILNFKSHCNKNMSDMWTAKRIWNRP